jgi:Uma2 family endonuclease
MSTAFAGSAMAWERLLDTWRGLQVPEGWRPELTAEGMTPPPGGPHNLIADLVHEALGRARPDGCGVFQTLGVAIRATGSIYVPNLCVVPRAAVPGNADPIPAEHVLIAVEITSPGNGDHDRKKKKWAYAHGDIPQYLLIDAFDEDGPAVSLFTEPIEGVYSRTVRVPFGQSIEIGEPFGIRLETTEF